MEELYNFVLWFGVAAGCSPTNWIYGGLVGVREVESGGILVGTPGYFRAGRWWHRSCEEGAHLQRVWAAMAHSVGYDAVELESTDFDRGPWPAGREGGHHRP